MALGFTGLIHISDNQKRYYNAIALRDTLCLTIQKADLADIIDQTQKRE